jgi:glycolate oxidase iron-sulfur subunit
VQTSLRDEIRATPEGREAEAILRACVHCGFCTATCPTYQLLGDERDGPRGRIYLIKQILDGERASERTRLHLDRCLTCGACETTCPSGVQYGRLADIGRRMVEQQVSRPLPARLLRKALRSVLPYPSRTVPLVKLGRVLRPILPRRLKAGVPAEKPAGAWPAAARPRRVLLLEGCVQSATAPSINAATARVFDAVGITVKRTPAAGCCGALNHHLSAAEEALDFARRNIDAWWPEVQAGAEAIVVNASGCAVMVKDYGWLLRRDPNYSAKAERISSLAKDPAQVLQTEDMRRFKLSRARRIAFHAPCTLQHGLRLAGVTEALLRTLGYELSPIADSHLCCGSAGAYSILQSKLSRELLENKIRNLEAGDPEMIATANIGCLLHLQSATARPVMHWVELIDQTG